MVVAYRNLVSALVPFGFRSYWDLVGVGHRGLGNKGLGTGLDNQLEKRSTWLDPRSSLNSPCLTLIF